tara:strand:+ start:1428 stop:1814 length:387 start_codon:yes stop_codon:yes gene_type:complete
MDSLIQSIVAICLGMMIFFSFILAPMIFKILDPENAGKFVRKIFPYYYFVNLVFLSIVVILILLNSKINFEFYIIVSLVISFIFAQFILMPFINKLRDNNEEDKFKYAHGFSVAINFLQMIGLVFLLI